jgi:hypothetical protein
MFMVRAGDRVARFAFLPPYLAQLTRSVAEFRETRGWQLTQSALHEINAECVAHRIAFTLMFVPEKAQVYWPTVERMFSAADVEQAMAFYGLPAQSGELERIRTNRLAQNELLREFCEREGIRMLDLTPALEREVEAGREVYFPDDTHWNAAGHDVASRELAAFLAAHP